MKKPNKKLNKKPNIKSKKKLSTAPNKEIYEEISKIDKSSEKSLIVLSPEPGMGKTSTMIHYVADNFNEGRGCIVVIERHKKREGERLKNRIDRLAGNKIAHVMYGFSKEICQLDEDDRKLLRSKQKGKKGITIDRQVESKC